MEIVTYSSVSENIYMDKKNNHIYIYRVCQKKKDILNIHIKSEGINIFSQKFCWTESTIFVVKFQ